MNVYGFYGHNPRGDSKAFANIENINMENVWESKFLQI